MEAGKKQNSPIVQAIAEAEQYTTGEIQVHLSRRWFETNPLKRAIQLFRLYGMEKTENRNGVLLYVNLRRRKFAVVGDEGIHKIVGQKYWQELTQNLHEDLQSTHPECAIALAVRTLGVTLARFFPIQEGEKNPNELPNAVKSDY